jgi:hypothetical protein
MASRLIDILAMPNQTLDQTALAPILATDFVNVSLGQWNAL